MLKLRLQLLYKKLKGMWNQLLCKHLKGRIPRPERTTTVLECLQDKNNINKCLFYRMMEMASTITNKYITIRYRGTKWRQPSVLTYSTLSPCKAYSFPYKFWRKRLPSGLHRTCRTKIITLSVSKSQKP